MDSSSGRRSNREDSLPSSEKPPKLRAACNECHCAKVRCTGEKDGCQRCENLNLQCIFAISRLGKVPGKRARANKIANAANARTMPTEQQQSTQSASDASVGSSLSSQSGTATTTSACGTDPTFLNTFAGANTPANQTRPDRADGMPLFAELCGPDTITVNPDLLDISFTGDSSWLPNPGISYLDSESVASYAPSSRNGFDLLDCDMDMRINTVDSYESLGHIGGGRASPSKSSRTGSHDQAMNSDSRFDSITPLPFEYDSSGDPCTQLLQLISNIERCLAKSRLSDASSVDVILAANQRFISELQRLQNTPSVTRTYSLLMLSSVALGKSVNLFVAGHRDFVVRLQERSNVGAMEKLVRFGAFEIDPVEQRAICQTIFLREIKRARLCLCKLMTALENSGCGATGTGRHEEFHCEMEKRLSQMAASLACPDMRRYC